MPDKPDERLIILLPPDLLEQVRRAAEEADLSVSQIVRRALRNELKTIAASKNKLTEREVRGLLERNQVPLSSLLGPSMWAELVEKWSAIESSKPSGTLSDLAGGLSRIEGTEAETEPSRPVATRNKFERGKK